MTRVWLALGAALLVGGCAATRAPGSDAPPGDKGPDLRFSQVRDAYLAEHFADHPVEAVGLGWHQHDGRFIPPTAANLQADAGRDERLLVELAGLPDEGLSSPNRVDRAMLLQTAQISRWSIKTVRAPFSNPMTYPLSLDVSVYLKRDWKPLPARIADLARILDRAPEVFAAARENLDQHLARPLVETAIEVAESTAAFITNDVAKEARTVRDDSVRSSFARAAARSSAALVDYAAWLRTEKLPRADASFALGKEGFAERLRAERIDLTPEEVLAVGEAELKREEARFAAAARVIDPLRAPEEVFRAIQSNHPTAAGLIPDTRRDLEMIRRFVVERRLVTIPSRVRATVRETLPPFRATSFASMDTPGPFERKATEAYYYVTPVEPDWSPKQQDEWLTAFNRYTTDIVSIHEAYPGHYVQFLALDASGAGPAAKAFGSYSFIEGWAHYCEQMMVEQGFPAISAGIEGGDSVQVQHARFRLAQSDEALLRLCRLVSAVRMHCFGMSIEESARFFMSHCHYAEKPARSEALRGAFDPGYCFYSLGKLELLKLRRDWEAQEGPRASLQRFHDEVLRHGAPPVRVLREIMLHDPALWPKVL